MAGKYAKVTDTLPRLAGEEPAYQEKVNAVRQAILDSPTFQRHASTLAKMYTDLRRGDSSLPVKLTDAECDALIAKLGKDGIEELLYECNLRLTAVTQLLSAQYEAEGVTSMRLDDGGSVSQQLEPYAQVQDKEAFRKWCIAEGLDSLMTLPWATANQLTKQRLLEGEPEPPGIKAYAVTKFVLRNK